VVAERTGEEWAAGVEQAQARREELIARGLERAAQYRWPQVAAAVREVLREAASS
jgi:hypothetical protein